MLIFPFKITRYESYSNWNRLEPVRRRKTHLYKCNEPKSDFNLSIKNWLDGTENIREHTTPAAFSGLRESYNETVKRFQRHSKLPLRDAHRVSLSQLTELMFGHNLFTELEKRLEVDLINESGFRTTISQGVAKNVGENFVNSIVYALSSLLQNNDDILVDKGLPPPLKRAMTLERTVNLATGPRTFHIPIEGDMAIFARDNPLNAIVISAKTRLKEVFHIGTMWKIFFDMIDDQYSLEKWGLKSNVGLEISDTLYLFATADMVNKGGKKSQGPDVERDQPRNLIAMDASFFDYVMVSKSGIPHVSKSLDLKKPRESLFHELGCLIDLIEQKFNIKV